MELRLLALACLVGAALAGPYQRPIESRCSKECDPSSELKFAVEVGKAYVFNYTVENKVIQHGQEQKARITATVEIHVISKCEGLLRMKDIVVGQDIPHEDLEAFKDDLGLTLGYSFNNGEVDKVCPNPGESTYSLNVKKGILSTLVNSMNDTETPQEVIETDSMGSCKTKYTVSKEPHHLVITKEKDLKSCTKGHALITPFFKKNIPNSLFSEEDQSICVQSIEKGIIKEVSCIEKKKLKTPIEALRLSFEGKLTMKQVSVKPAEHNTQEETYPPEELLYSMEDTRPADGNEKEIKRLMNNYCSKGEFMKFKVVKHFAELVSQVKRCDYSKLERIHKEVKSGCATHAWHDALFLCRTDDCVKLMVKILEENEISSLKSAVWRLSFATFTNPKPDTMNRVCSLLKSDRSQSTVIGVSKMVSHYCRSGKCHDLKILNEVTSILGKELGSCCSSNDHSKVMKNLQIFGNMGYHGSAHSNILCCLKDSNKPHDRRLAAIESLRLFEECPEELLEVYTKPPKHKSDDDFELRIAAFATCVKNANGKQMEKIKVQAEKESDEQVAAYVQSYFKNIKETKLPSKQNMKKLVEKRGINPHPVEQGGNSKHIEFSAYNKLVDIGGSIEADIIRSPDSKFPQTVNTKVHVEGSGHNLDLIEMKGTLKGVEKMMSKLVSMKNKIPSEPTMSDWDSIRSEAESFIREMDAEGFFVLRLLGIDVFDTSTGEWHKLTELLKLFDKFIERLTNGLKSDFSHSFVFLDTKLAIPSITGRSYSIGLSGASTVGLSSDSKLDVVDKVDGHILIKPSLDVQLSADVQIQTSSHKPNMKVVSRMHVDMDVGAKIVRKKGHVSVALLTPSENLLHVKISNSIVKTDEHHQEIPVFGKPHKKIESCYDGLHKPLGISVCFKAEVKDSLVKSLTANELEFSVKKSDVKLHKYECRCDNTDHHKQRVFEISCDTPGSEIRRRIGAKVELKHHGDHKEVLGKITCPSQSLSVHGLYHVHHKQMHGYLAIVGNSKRLFNINVTHETSSSRSKESHKASATVFVKNNLVYGIYGSLNKTHSGKKEHLSFEGKTHHDLIVKGGYTKEGHIGLAKNKEGKLSTEFSIIAPSYAFHMRETIVQQSKKSHAISTKSVIEYLPTGGEKQSITCLGTVQKSTGKINTKAKCKSTYSKADFSLVWDLQKDSTEHWKNDMLFSYGSNPEKNFIHLDLKSRFNLTGASECKAALKIPQLGMNYDFTLKHDIDFSDDPKIYLDADLRKKDVDGKVLKQLKGMVDFKGSFDSPMKASTIVSFDFPGGPCTYEDHVEETRDGSFVGSSKVTCGEVKKLLVNYKVGGPSGSRHEIESSLEIPSSPAPIRSKASMQFNNRILSVEGELGSLYYVKILVNPDLTEISLKSQKIIAKYSYKDERSSINIEANVEHPKPQHIKVSGHLDLNKKKQCHLKIMQNDKKKFDLFIDVNKTKTDYTSVTKLVVSDVINFSLVESGDLSMFGRQDCTFEASIKNYDPIRVVHHSEIEQNKAKSIIKYSKNNKEKAVIDVEASLNKEDNKEEYSIKTSIVSPDKSFKDVSISFKHEMSRYGSSAARKTDISFKRDNSDYNAQLSSDFNSNGLEINALMHSPIANFEKQGLSAVLQSSSNGISSSLSFKTSDDKTISISTEMKDKGDGYSFTCKMRSPFDCAKSVLVSSHVHDRDNKKTLGLRIDVNDEIFSDLSVSAKLSSTEPEIEGSLSIPKKDIEIRMEYKRDRSSELFLGKAVLAKNKEISITTDVKEKKDGITATLVVVTPLESWKKTKAHCSVHTRSSLKKLSCFTEKNGEQIVKFEGSLSKTSSKSTEIRGSVKVLGKPEISSVLKFEKDKESTSLTCNVLKSSSPWFYTNMLYKRGKKFEFETTCNGKKTLQLEISKDISGSSSEKYSMKANGPFPPVSVSVFTNLNGKSSLSINFKDSSLGYEIQIHKDRQGTEHCSMKFDVIPNTNNPTKKYGLEAKKAINHHLKEISVSVKLSHPDSAQPISVSGKLQIVGKSHLPRGKLVLLYPSNGLTVEITPEESSGRKSLSINVNTKDKRLTASLKCVKQTSANRIKIDYEGQYNSHEGKISLIVHTKSGKPKGLEVLFQSPSSEYEVLGSLAQGPDDDLSLSFASRGKQLGKFIIRTSDKCFDVIYTRSGPASNVSLCFNKQEHHKYNLVSLKAFVKNHKCIEAGISVDSKFPTHFNIVLECAKDDICNLLKEIGDFERIFHGHTTEEIIKELKKKFEKYIKEFIEPIRKVHEDVMRKVSSKWKEIMTHIIHMYESYVFTWLPKPEDVRKCLHHLKDTVVKTLKSHFPDFYEHLRVLLKDFPDYAKKYIKCSGLCRYIVEFYKSHHLKQIRLSVSERFREVKDSILPFIFPFPGIIPGIFQNLFPGILPNIIPGILPKIIPGIEILNPLNILKLINGGVQKVKDYVKERVINLLKHKVFEKIKDLFKQYGKKFEEKFRELVINKIDQLIKKINSLFQSDEDLRRVKEAVFSYKDKALDSWKNKDEIARSYFKKFGHNFKMNIERWVNKLFRVITFQPKEGKIAVQVSQPFGKTDIENLKRAFPKLESIF
ncbi:vitellogenin [Caerostris darwini]|uniref:Vitellogenin n=1 Tax=Caerostris darwini TaxID=1538125 RepID=A0AAV4QKS7_9ARAC|nr:vitellogenin [Caerostris darwini]